MHRFIDGEDRMQQTLLPNCLEDYVGQENPGEAARSLRRALELNPNFALAHALLADALALQGVHQEAVDSAEHALRLSPRDRLVGTSASLAMAQVNFGEGAIRNASPGRAA